MKTLTIKWKRVAAGPGRTVYRWRDWELERVQWGAGPSDVDWLLARVGQPDDEWRYYATRREATAAVRELELAAQS